MKLPRTEDLAILLMSELALRYGKDKVSLSAVANNHGVSVLFLKKLARLLRQAELIISKEGVNGGYSLSKNPNEITVWQIIQAVAENDLVLEQKSMQNTCPLYAGCIPQKIRSTISNQMEKALSDITLAKLIKKTI